MNELSFLYKDGVLKESEINLDEIIYFENDLELFNVRREDLVEMVYQYQNNSHKLTYFSNDSFLNFKYARDCPMGYYNFVSKLINNYLVYTLIEDCQNHFIENKDNRLSESYLNEKKAKLEKCLTISILAMNPIDREFMLIKLNEDFISSYERKNKNVILDGIIDSAKSCVLNVKLFSERFISCLPVSQIKAFDLFHIDKSFKKNEHYLYFTIMKCFSDANKINSNILKNFKVKDEKICELLEKDVPSNPLFLNYKSFFDLKNYKKYLEFSSNVEHPEHQRGIANLKKMESSMIDIFLKSLILKSGEDFLNENVYVEVFSNFFSIVINNENYQQDIIKICQEQLSTSSFSVKDVFMIFAISSCFHKDPNSFYEKVGSAWVNGLFDFDEKFDGDLYQASIEIDLNKFLKIAFLSNIAKNNVALQKMTGSDFKIFYDSSLTKSFEKFLSCLITLENAQLLKKEAKKLNSFLLNYEADETINKHSKMLGLSSSGMFDYLRLDILKADLRFLGASFRLKENKYIIETNDKDDALFIKKYVKKFLLASREMENDMKVYIEEYLMKKEVKDISVNKNKIRKF